MFKIVADRNIPELSRLLADAGDVALFPGEDITSVSLREASILLVRSVTRVDGSLLDGTSVRFVGTATAGIDHIDTRYLAERGIAFAHAPGSNAASVVDYVVAALVRSAFRRKIGLRTLTFGIVGFGEVGSRLAARLRNGGVRTLINDPPLESQGHAFPAGMELAPLRQLLVACDVVSLHVPLELEGPHATRHLIGAPELKLMRRDALLINSSRGAVVDGKALRDALESRVMGNAVLDVFENEPRPNRQLIGLADIATPHIAGYALDSKLEGARVIARKVRSFVGLEDERELEPAPSERIRLDALSQTASEEEWAYQVVRQMYDIESDSAALKRAAAEDEDLASSFQRLRRQYPERRTFDRYFLDIEHVPKKYRAITSMLGVSLTSGVV